MTDTKFKKGELNPSWKGGLRKASGGYLIRYMPTHQYAWKSNGCVKEHRLIFEDYITKKWGIKFIIHPKVECHHINGNRTDNRIENLQLLTKSQHKALHNIGNSYRKNNKEGDHKS